MHFLEPFLEGEDEKPVSPPSLNLEDYNHVAPDIAGVFPPSIEGHHQTTLHQSHQQVLGGGMGFSVQECQAVAVALELVFSFQKPCQETLMVLHQLPKLLLSHQSLLRLVLKIVSWNLIVPEVPSTH